MIPAVAYLRMSTDAQEASIKSQRDAVKQYAATHGYRILREYIDEGISGDDTTKRLSFLRMLADASKREFKVVLCWDQDRFGRFDLMEAGFYIKPLRDAGVSLATVTQGVIDWTDFAGRLVYSIQQESKHQFLRDLSKNVNRGKHAKVLAGKWMGGAAPYGYKLIGTATLAIAESEADVVRLIFQMVGQGRSFTSTQDELNERGIPAPHGGKWHRTSVSRIIDNIVYCGHTFWNRTSQARYSSVLAGTIVARTGDGRPTANDRSAWTVVKNAHPAIVTEEQFAAAHTERKKSFAWGGRPSPRVVAFRGILKCGRCGRAMHGSWVEVMGDVVYICSGYTESRACEPNRTYQKQLLEYVIKHIFHAMLDPAAIATAHDKYMAARSLAAPKETLQSLQKARIVAETRVAKAESRLMEVPPDMVAVASIKVRERRQELDDVNARIAAAEKAPTRQRDIAADFAGIVGDIRDSLTAIEQGDESVISLVLRQTFEQLTVTSGKGPLDPPKARCRISEVTPILKYPDIMHS